VPRPRLPGKDNPGLGLVAGGWWLASGCVSFSRGCRAPPCPCSGLGPRSRVPACALGGFLWAGGPP
jgi:hypothetical protein